MLRKLAIALGVILAVAIVALVVVIAVFDFNRLKPIITARVASFSGRELKIGGDLIVEKSLTPRIETSDIWFENAKWGKEPAFVAIKHLRLRLRLLDLLRGRVVLPELEIEGLDVALEKDAKGDVNWKLPGASPAEAAAETVMPEGRSDFPMIHDFALRDGHIRYRAAGKKLTDLEIKEANGYSDTRGVSLDAGGVYQRRPASLKVEGEPVGRLWATDRPYPLRISVQTGGAPDAPKERFKAEVDGTLTNTFDKGKLGLQLKVEGTDMAQLYPLAGIVLPKTPPYSLRGKLGHAGDEWRFDGFDGRMGDSDLGGDLTIRTAADPPDMKARFVSEKLDLDDLAGLVGAPPSTESGETASAEQRAEARKAEEEKRIVPDQPIKLQRLHAMNVEASLEAKQVVTKRIPIDNVSLAVKLADGVLRARPVRFRIGGGAIDLDVALHANAKPVRADVATEIRNVPLDALFKTTAFDDESAGVIDGKAKLSSHGDSVREIAGRVSGEAFVAMSRGKISHLLIELIGLDIFESLGVALTEDKPIDIRCAIAKLEAQDGKMTADPIVFDTEDTKITGKGSIDLSSEKLNVLFVPYPKDFSPFTVRSPIRVSGKLADLSVFPDAAGLGPGHAIKQALAVTLSAIIGMLPPLDVVMGQDSPCRDLLNDARDSIEQTEVSGQPRPADRESRR